MNIRSMLALIERDRCPHNSAHVNSPKLVSLDQGHMNDPASSAGWSLSVAINADIRALLDRRMVSESPTWSTPRGFQGCSPFAIDAQRAYAGPCLGVNFGTINRCRIELSIDVFVRV